MSRGHFLEGFIIGGLVGVIGGLLFAPHTGEETRRRISKLKEDNEELIEETKDKTENLIEKTRDAIENGFAKLHHLIEDNKEGSKGPSKS